MSTVAKTIAKKRAEPTGTRERILAHAVQIASAEGLEALTIGRLASELGMSKSGLFGHFGSKEGLQLATIESGASIYGRAVIDPAFKKPAGAERLRALAYGFVDYLEGSVFDGGCFWSSVAAEFDNREGPVRDLIEQNVGRWVGILVDQAKLAGFDDPRQLAFELHAIGQGANMQYQLFRDASIFDRARRTIDRLLGA
jgi:AcrR family transcriptional regulator